MEQNGKIHTILVLLELQRSLRQSSKPHAGFGENGQSIGIASTIPKKYWYWYCQYFLARDSIYAIARYMPSSVRPSVCLSVRHTGGSVEDG